MAKGPTVKRTWAFDSDGKKTEKYWAKPTATAASEPMRITQKATHA